MVNTFLKSALLVAVVVALSACATAPVQEMSNARQAVAAAEQGGAAKAAPQHLALAKYLLETAQTALDNRQYSKAREDALRARQEAVKALRISQGLEAPEPASS